MPHFSSSRLLVREMYGSAVRPAARPLCSAHRGFLGYGLHLACRDEQENAPLDRYEQEGNSSWERFASSHCVGKADVRKQSDHVLFRCVVRRRTFHALALLSSPVFSPTVPLTDGDTLSGTAGGLDSTHPMAGHSPSKSPPLVDASWDHPDYRPQSPPCAGWLQS